MEWHGDEFLEAAHTAFGQGIEDAARFTVNAIRQSISVSSHGLDTVATTTGHRSIVRRGASRSAPGQPPHMDSGQLLSSISEETDRENLNAVIGSGLEYSLYLELGTRKMAPRPFLRRALADNAVAIVSIATKNEYRA